MDKQTVGIGEAAEALGISKELEAFKEKKRWHIVLEPEQDTKQAYSDVEQDRANLYGERIGELREQVEWLRRELERKDSIIMALTQRIPELPAPNRANPRRNGPG